MVHPTIVNSFGCIKYLHFNVLALHKAPNITKPGSFVYFIADPPYLIKTVRNGWYHSQENGSCSLVVCISV